jgi:hypothetical protein
MRQEAVLVLAIERIANGRFRALLQSKNQLSVFVSLSFSHLITGNVATVQPQRRQCQQIPL